MTPRRRPHRRGRASGAVTHAAVAMLFARAVTTDASETNQPVPDRRAAQHQARTRRTRRTWRATTIATHALMSVLVAVSSWAAKAELLGDYFPDGVPGYDTAAGVTVATRLRPSYDPLGTKISGIGAQPQLDESIGYDSNPLGVANGRGSAVVVTSPHIYLSDQMDTWQVGAYAGLTDSRYLEQSSDSRTDYDLALGAVFNVGDGRLTLSAAHLALHQDPLTIDAIPGDRPIGFTIDDIRATYGLEFGRWTASPSLSYQQLRYSGTTLNGVPLPQGYRDRDMIAAGIEARYQLSPQRSALVVMRGIDTHYINTAPGLPSQDSQSAEALVGLDYDDDGVWLWRVLVGGEIRQFSSRAYPTHVAPVVEGDVFWNPSGMTTVSAMLSRSIEDASQEGVAGYTYTRARLVLDHEYLRNVLLQARAALQVAQFLQVGGVQTIETFGAGATWLVNRHVRVSLNYDHTAQQGGPRSGGPVTGNYARDTALVTVRLAM